MSIKSSYKILFFSLLIGVGDISYIHIWLMPQWIKKCHQEVPSRQWLCNNPLQKRLLAFLPTNDQRRGVSADTQDNRAIPPLMKAEKLGSSHLEKGAIPMEPTEVLKTPVFKSSPRSKDRFLLKSHSEQKENALILVRRNGEQKQTESLPPMQPRSDKKECSIEEQKKHHSVTIYFLTNRYSLTPVAKKSLIEIIKRLHTCQNLSISLHGHADQRGNALNNINLSLQCAHAVANYLKRKQIAKERIIFIKGWGSKKPVDKRQTFQAWKRNRRVTINFSDQ
ncbi:OmpA family protein [Magnetococcales bacterium HHB-1]